MNKARLLLRNAKSCVDIEIKLVLIKGNSLWFNLMKAVLQEDVR